MVNNDVESHIGAQGPRPSWWRLWRRKRWDREAALSAAATITMLDIDGDAHFTLGAPAVAGQRRRITCAFVARGRARGTVHVATCGGFEFNRIGQSIDLVADGPAWRVIGARRVGAVA